MGNSNIKIFLTEYLNTLKERTSYGKKTIYGFDWVIYNLALAKNLIPVRLPFYRQGKRIKIKTESEYGEDISFVASNKKTLFVFVLKDEELTNRNWTKHNFDEDLRKAVYPDLSSIELRRINKVNIVLAYNKDEDKTGIQLYERLRDNLQGKNARGVEIVFQRWNLSRIVEEVEENLLNINLLPQDLSSLLNYINSQFTDFKYGTIEWEKQLLPNWKNFLATVLKDKLDERKIQTLIIALIILQNGEKDQVGPTPKWIDLTEWTMLALWDAVRKSGIKKLYNIVFQLWTRLYIGELDKYIVQNAQIFTTEHGINSRYHAPALKALLDSNIAFWNLARLGIFTIGIWQIIDTSKEEGKKVVFDAVHRSAEYFAVCMRNNPSTLRPFLDIHHIQLFLVWFALWQAGRTQDIFHWLFELEGRLLTRRMGNSHLPFIEGRNRIELVAEFIATDEKPYGFTDETSYLLMMVLELCFSLSDNQRNQLLERYHRRIVLGIGNDDKPLVDNQIDLMGWIPPEDWKQTVLQKCVQNGISISTRNFLSINQTEIPLAEKIKEFVDKTRKAYPYEIPNDIPFSVYILACLKHDSPLPMEFWRKLIFDKKN